MAAENFLTIKNVVDEWFSRLQYERKCNSTNTVSKIVNNSSEEIQEKVCILISQNINLLIEKCRESRQVQSLQLACNAINGCFDNFVHAAAAVALTFRELLSFINFAVDECQLSLIKNITRNSSFLSLELLYSLSRILILILKLKRTQKFQGKNLSIKKVYCFEGDLTEDSKILLSFLTHKLGFFLMRDDVLIDTKNNFAISGILIREILTPDENELKKYHRKFIEAIPFTLESQDSQLHILQFLISSAIINTWSVNIIDANSTYKYLRFFINLCENYSSETPVVLNTSRALLLLIKHDSFREFILKGDNEKIKITVDLLLPCVFMLLEHPVACVRHSAKDFLLVLATYLSLQDAIIDFTFKLPKDKRSYFICLAALAAQLGSRILIEKNTDLPVQLINGLNDPTIVSHVSYAVENMMLKDYVAEENFSVWCETWIIPLIISLNRVVAMIGAEIEKLLEKAFKKYPSSVIFVIEKWNHPTSSEQLRCVVTALKISHRQGFKFKAIHSSAMQKKYICKESKNEVSLCKWDKLIDEKLLEHCLHQGDDDIRMSAFSLLIEGPRTTEAYSETDFVLIKYFLKYNLNNQQPATRQKILGLIRKLLLRFSDSQANFQKVEICKISSHKKSELIESYNNFLEFLVEFCFCNIFVGCNFNRLNTVLNILILLFEYVKNMSFDSNRTNYYWEKFLIALDSSYEENKELTVILSKKLDFSFLNAAKPEKAKLLFEKSFNLITHMEPPDVLTGSYLLRILINLPSGKEVLLKYFIQNEVGDGCREDNVYSNDMDCVTYCCVKILMNKLKEQLPLAQLDLMTAATCGPIYGCLAAIRLILKSVNFSDVPKESASLTESALSKWIKILNDLVDLCFDIIPIVSCVVNSSSPEGHLPMDFQTNFENLSLNLSNEGFVDKEYFSQQSMMNAFINKFKKLERILENPPCDVYEGLRSLLCLLKENKVLISKVIPSNEVNFIQQLTDIREKIEKYIEQSDANVSVMDWPATAQVVLLCAWRSIKEISLYLGDFVRKLPVKTALSVGLLTETSLVRIGEELKILLCEIKHRGSFEHVYVAFTEFVNSLWKCGDPFLSNLPRQWLQEIADHLELPAKDQKLKFCSTRRSAGLPFLVQAVICSEIVSVKSSTPSSLHFIMKALLKIVGNPVSANSDSKIHALNILRALFKHTQLGEHVSSYISKALIVAIRGSRGYTWSERNSSNLLFSALVIRIFGVARSRDEISKKNRMTSRTFFQRYPELYQFMLSEMELARSEESAVKFIPKPSLYLVLLILGRLNPPPREDPDAIDVSEFLPFIDVCRKNPVMKIRELGARAIVPLIPFDKLLDELDERFSLLSLPVHMSQNEMHGILLQIRALLTESAGVLENFIEGNRRNEVAWIENSKWILNLEYLQNHKTSFVVASSYIKVLHAWFKYHTSHRAKIAGFIENSSSFENLCSLKKSELKSDLGVFTCLDSFYYLKTEISSYKCVRSDNLENDEAFSKLILFMLNCDIDEVRSIGLRVLCFVLSGETGAAFVEDDFIGVGAPVGEILAFQAKENLKKFRVVLINNIDILKCLMLRLSDSNEQLFKSKVIRRLWLKSLSSLILEGTPSVGSGEFDELRSVLMEKFLALLDSEDKEVSSNSLICYAVFTLGRITQDASQIFEINLLSTLSKLLGKFSSSHADFKHKLAVAKIINYSFDILIDKGFIAEMNLWMVPIKLLLEEDATLRKISHSFVYKIHDYIVCNIEQRKLLMKTDTLDWPLCSLVPLKAQECLLDSYINIADRGNLIHLVGHMITVALSSLCDVKGRSSDVIEEFGVFEKGNPNPYCEEMALSNLMCFKIAELRRITDLDEILKSELSKALVAFLVENFHITGRLPTTLWEVIQRVTEGVEKNKRDGGEFSVMWLQTVALKNAIGL